jgi:hypothetical protein
MTTMAMTTEVKNQLSSSSSSSSSSSLSVAGVNENENENNLDQYAETKVIIDPSDEPPLPLSSPSNKVENKHIDKHWKEAKEATKIEIVKESEEVKKKDMKWVGKIVRARVDGNYDIEAFFPKYCFFFITNNTLCA